MQFSVDKYIFLIEKRMRRESETKESGETQQPNESVNGELGREAWGSQQQHEDEEKYTSSKDISTKHIEHSWGHQTLHFQECFER